ncbi:MAG TPA: AAA family ATPase [Chroococcales cyanobacterium]|jgi:predicted kinase
MTLLFMGDSSLLVSHFLVGPPSSGKSTLAQQLIQLNPTARIVSTDAIRALLFGDEGIQGDWSLVEQMVLSQMQEAFDAGCPVIYDATNARREWRQSILGRVSRSNVQWIAWHLQTPLSLCKAWNAKRQRQVPENAIEEFFQVLRDNPPQVSEGFIAVRSLVVTPMGFELAQVEEILKG